MVVLTTSATSGSFALPVNGSLVAPTGVYTVRQHVLDRAREAAADDLQQFRDAQPGGRHAGQHGVKGAARDGGLQVVDDCVEAHLFAGQVAVQQAVVLGLGDHRFDQRLAPAGDQRDLVVVGRPRLHGCRSWSRTPAGTAGRSTRTARRSPAAEPGTRDVQRVHALAEHQLAVLHGRVEIASWLVDVGDDHGPRHAHIRAFLPEDPGGAVDRRAAGGGVGRGDDEQCGVRGPQPGAQFTDEVGMPGGVDEVDPHGRGARWQQVADPGTRVLATESDTDRCRRFSTSSKSQTVLPFSMLPGRLMAPVAASTASTSIVFPAPPGPTRTTLRTCTPEESPPV